MGYNAVNKKFEYLSGNVLPTVLAVSIIILSGFAGILTLYGYKLQLLSNGIRSYQNRANIESAFTLYQISPDRLELTAPEGYPLYDSIDTKVHIQVLPWGLYELVKVSTTDSIMKRYRLFGISPQNKYTLYYPDNRRSIMLAGQTNLHGMLFLPLEGITYGRIKSDFFTGEKILHSAINHAGSSLPSPSERIEKHISELLQASPQSGYKHIAGNTYHSFSQDSTIKIQIDDAEIGNCHINGRIIIYGNNIRIDSTCTLKNVIVCGRKITIGHGARLSAQFIASDSILIESRAILEFPSGIYSQHYAELGEGATVNGYAVVYDTIKRESKSANYRQHRTARMRGFVWVDGIAEVRGLVAGLLMIREAVYFSPDGYYENSFYDLTLLEDSQTTLPLWLADSSSRRKEILCVD